MTVILAAKAYKKWYCNHKIQKRADRFNISWCYPIHNREAKCFSNATSHKTNLAQFNLH